MKIGYVYKLMDPINNECRYVGITTQKISVRLYRHLRDVLRYKNHKNSWLLGLKNKGLLDKVRIEIIEECDYSVLKEREVFWINEFKTKGCRLTNMTIGGDVGSLGCKHTDEAKRKISEAGKRLKGIKRSDETRKKISDSLRGKKGRNTGNKHSEKTKRQISESKKDTLSWNAQPILQLDREGNIINEWRSATYAAKKLGLNQGNIWSVINGDRNTCGGFKWEIKK